ncbi:unnamed protein product [Peronospora destructor]|uniref:RxLR effector PexRD54 WY domain-containing protein n=1 Tax=Peronospora destructor TaxID=86335 RepID=A0AAV0T017_9STRA|nr:unnamed protein product [Peronospora destructor]
MRLPLIKICAFVAVSLVTVGVHAESPNVITKSARALELGQGTKHLRTQDDEEERAFDIADEFSSIVKKYKADVLKSASPLHEVATSALKSNYFTDLFERIYTRGMLSDEVYRGMEVFEQDVKVAIRNAYVKFVNEKYHDMYPTLAKPVHPTFAEPVHPTLDEPLSTRPKDKGPAEVVGVQLAPKAFSFQDRNAVWNSWLQHGAHPVNVLKLLKLDEAGDDLLENMPIFSRWIAYVMKFSDMYPNNPTTVVAALENAGFEEKTLVNMVFSWDLRQKRIIEQVEENLRIHPNGKKEQTQKMLLLRHEEVRTEILDRLMKSWFDRDDTIEKVLDTLGLSPTLPTGFDFSRVVELIKYVKLWARKYRNPLLSLQPRQMLSSFKKTYSEEQINELLKHADYKSNDEALINWIVSNLSKRDASTSLGTQRGSTQKRKRDT